MSTYRAWCKAKRADEHEEVQRSAGWMGAKRAWFKVFPDRYECGSWSFPKSSIRRAVVYRSSQLKIPVTVLQLDTVDGSFQFGFNPWARVTEHLGIDYREHETGMTSSRFSVAIRVAALAYVTYWIWTDVIAR